MLGSNLKLTTDVVCNKLSEKRIVFIRKQENVRDGEIAAVVLDDEATLKRVYYTPGSNRITLRACNPMYPDMEYEGESLSHIRILGKAVAFTSTIRL